MDKQQLLASLDALRIELAEVDSIGDDTRAALDKVAEDLHRVLDPEQETTDDDAAASQEGLQGMLQHFEAEHPKLAEAIGRIADGLANLGI